MMADVLWTLNFYMKDAPSGKEYLEERMDKDLICYFDIIGFIEKQGYTSMDYLKRNGHGRRRSELVEIISDLDVSRMVCEHEVDQKLTFYVIKQSDGLNTGIRRSEQLQIGARADVERRKALLDEGVHGSGYNTESSHETDREAERAERQAVLEAMKRRRADPNVSRKRQKRPRNSRVQSEDQEHEEEDGGDLDDHMEPLDNGDGDQEILEDSPVQSENEDQDLTNLYTTISGVSPESGSIKIIWSNGVVQEYRGRFTVSNVMNIKSGGKKTCQRDSEAGKQQRHPHTTGRKSHARLRKELEVKNKGPVSKIDLWDEAHKKKDGKYTNENVQQLMHKARKKIEIIKRKNNGELSPEDYDKMFDDVIAKESTISGYYDEKYWGIAKLCRGSTSVQRSSSEARLQNELQEVQRNLENVTGLTKRMFAFMVRNHPDEHWSNEVTAPRNEIKTGGQREEDPPPCSSPTTYR